MKKTIVFVLVALMVLVAFTGCAQKPSSDAGETATPAPAETDNGQQPADDGGFVIGYANGYIGNTWRSQMVDNFQQKAEELKQAGVIKDYTIANTDNDVTEQMNQLNSMINDGVDALIIDPVSPTSLTSVVAKAQEKGILVVISNDPAAYEGTYAVVGNNYSWFEIQTKWIAEKLGGEGDIVMIDGVSGNAADVHDPLFAGIGQHYGHLKNNLEQGVDTGPGAAGKILGAVPALEHEGFSLDGLGQSALQGARLTRKDQTRQFRHLAQRRLVRSHVRPLRLLIGRKGTPTRLGPSRNVSHGWMTSSLPQVAPERQDIAHHAAYQGFCMGSRNVGDIGLSIPPPWE